MKKSALIKDSITREIIFCPKFKFFIPEYSIMELRKYYPVIAKKGSFEED